MTPPCADGTVVMATAIRPGKPMTRQSAMNARRGISPRDRPPQDREHRARDQSGERAARGRHEPRIEREDGKPRHRQRGAEEDDRERAEEEAEREVVRAHRRP